MSKTAVLLGTSRYDGNTRDLVAALEARTSLTLFSLADYTISMYDYEHTNREDDFLPLITELLQYDHIVFATPVYWYSMSAQMKVFFDRISDLITIEKDKGRQFRGKSCSLVATGYQGVSPACFEDAFSQTFKYLGMDYRGYLYCSCQDNFVESRCEPELDVFLDKLA